MLSPFLQAPKNFTESCSLSCVAPICRPVPCNLILDVRVRSHFSLPDGGPKTYFTSRHFTTDVDIANFKLLQLVDFIGSKIVWGSKQYITFWRVCDDAWVEISSDEQLHEWLSLNIAHEVANIEADVDEFKGPLLCSPTKRRVHPNFRNSVQLQIESAPHISECPPADLTPPTAKVVEPPISKSKHTKRATRKRVSDETVGVDEEGSYSETESLVALSDSSYDTDLAASSDSDCYDSECSDSDNSYEPDDEIIDDDDDCDDIHDFSYDVDDPCIDVDVLFHNVDECKSAVTHHAILNDYAFQTVKKSKDRFRAKCRRAEEGCKWTFFASTSKSKYDGCKVCSELIFFSILSIMNFNMCAFM